MKTFELTIFTIITFGGYFSYVYYLLFMGETPAPSNLFFGIGSFLDAFLFNRGIKPKKAIADAPNRISEYLNPNTSQ
jgi:hypothetical protein